MRLLGHIAGSLLLILFLSATKPASAVNLVADISEHLIAITTAFTGSSVIVFGVAEEAESDIIVLVKGPGEPAVVRKKGAVGPIWVNTAFMEFPRAPSYYAVASSGTLSQIATPAELKRYEIGLNNIVLEPAPDREYSKQELTSFRNALLRNKQRDGLYSRGIASVHFQGGLLFRTELSFPANVPPGRYQIEVFEFKNGRVAHAHTSNLFISKVGLEAVIYETANNRPMIYAAFSILIAISSGWLASAMFKKS